MVYYLRITNYIGCDHDLDEYRTKESRKEFIKKHLDYSLVNGNTYFEHGNEFDYGVDIDIDIDIDRIIDIDIDIDRIIDEYNSYLDELEELQEERKEYERVKVWRFGTAG